MSRSDVNQTTAKAALTQMINVVFQRMEADDVLVEVGSKACVLSLTCKSGSHAALSFSLSVPVFEYFSA